MTIKLHLTWIYIAILLIGVCIADLHPKASYRRQHPPPGYTGGLPPGFDGKLPPRYDQKEASKENEQSPLGDDIKVGPIIDEEERYKITSTPMSTKRKRTTPFRMSFEEECDYLAFYCLKAYKTGRVCGRTIYYNYQDFKNYCMLDYVNCMERYEVWQVVHMGECFNLTTLKDYQHYEYHDDFFLDQMYVIEQ